MPDTQQTKPHTELYLVKGVITNGDLNGKSGQEIGPRSKAITAKLQNQPTTDFDWFDAAIICHEMSKITAKAA